MNSPNYYQCWFRLDARDAYLIWIGDDQDGVLTDSNGKIPCYLDSTALLDCANSLGLLIESSTLHLHDFDRLSAWLQMKDNSTVDCETLLNAWNLFQDVAASIKGAFDTDRKSTATIYEKLFFGCNLPSITPKGEKYEPNWTAQEIEIIKQVLSDGLALFRKNMVFN